MKTEQKHKISFKESCGIYKRDIRLNKEVYLLLIPVVIYYFVFHYMAMYGALIAFKDYVPKLGVMGSPWAGLRHFKNFFGSPSFSTVLLNTIRISLSSLLFEFPAPIILALLINELKSSKFARAVQTATYLPHFISLIVVCGMVKDFTRDTGIITHLLTFFGVPEVSLLGYPEYFLPIYIGSSIWQQVGWSSIIYLAALTGVDPQLYEAAKIDGANKWQQTLHVTLVGIMPTVITMLILRMGSILSVGYEKIILLYNDATLEVADVISSYVYRKGILEQSWSFSTAVNLFNSLINLVFLLLTNKISSKLNETSLW